MSVQGPGGRPTAVEIARVDAWRAEQERQSAERERLRQRHVCMAHGATRSRVLYGPMPWGYGHGCGACRRRWEREHGRPWESEAAKRERERREHAAMVTEIESMPPAAFYVEWERVRAERHTHTLPYHHGLYSGDPDEFGVNGFGGSTPAGRRYTAMRERVRRELRAFEDLAVAPEHGQGGAR